MAKCHYSADSAPLPPHSLRPGMSGSRKEDSLKLIRFAALPVTTVSFAYETYVLPCGSSAHIGESACCGRWLTDHDALDPKPGLSGLSSTTSSID